MLGSYGGDPRIYITDFELKIVALFGLPDVSLRDEASSWPMEQLQ